MLSDLINFINYEKFYLFKIKIFVICLKDVYIIIYIYILSKIFCLNYFKNYFFGQI